MPPYARTKIFKSWCFLANSGTFLRIIIPVLATVVTGVHPMPHYDPLIAKER